jgi:hypothetical protein
MFLPLTVVFIIKGCWTCSTCGGNTGASSFGFHVIITLLAINLETWITIMENGQTMTVIDNKTVLQALALINDCNKYKMDLTTNGVVITDAIKFVQTNKEKLTVSTKKEDDNGNESKEPDYDEDKDQLEEKQEEESGEQETTNQVF